jgi:hypothetical protein
VQVQVQVQVRMFTPLSKGSERRQYREWDGESVPDLVLDNDDLIDSYISENPAMPDKHKHSTRSRSSRRSSRQPLSPFRAPNPRNVTPYQQTRSHQHQRSTSTTHLLVKPQSPPPPPSPHPDVDPDRRGNQSGRSFRSRWSSIFLQPTKQTVRVWLDSWWKRQFVLVLAPCLFVWVWVAIPFPAHDATPKEGGGDGGGDGGDGGGKEAGGYGREIIEPNFAFFLFYYYGQSHLYIESLHQSSSSSNQRFTLLPNAYHTIQYDTSTHHIIPRHTRKITPQEPT